MYWGAVEEGLYANATVGQLGKHENALAFDGAVDIELH